MDFPRLILSSKSDNDELKREVESVKAPSAVSSMLLYSLISILSSNTRQPGSHTEGFSETFNTSVQLARSNSTQRYVEPKYPSRVIANHARSDEYWKLYETYTGTLKRLAEIQDSLESTKKDLSDAQTQSTF